MAVKAIVENAGEDFPGDVEKRASAMVIAKLAISLLFLEIEDCGVLEILRDLSLAPHRLEGRCELVYDLGPPYLGAVFSSATAVQGGYLVFIGRTINVGFVQLVFLGKLSVDGCVVVIEPVPGLTTCDAEDIQSGGLDCAPQFALAVLGGGVFVCDLEIG
ncbi:unnamed protein product [Schistocephalus solidus]|uniref:Uncharacterized protein n=1 Tax=Schistocephalus solidus TaxID=70667 RepID=A0A183T182_SCHSO|nr:unnamed protein product [Schistocephalus solidus]